MAKRYLLVLALALCACQSTRPPASALVLPERFTLAVPKAYDSARQPDAGMWSALGDPVLVTLIDRARAQNLSLAQARARLAEARALRGLETYALFPVITAAADAERNRPSRRDPFIPPEIGQTETFRAGFDAHWEIDLFGGARAARRALRAEETAAAAEVEAATIAVVGEVAQAYFALRAERDRLTIHQQRVENLRENLRLLRLRAELGRDSEAEVARSNALGLASAARLPLVEAAVHRHEQRLVVLTATSLPELRSILAANSVVREPLALIPVGDPASWFRRRPDIRAAEARLQAATQRIGIDAAELFPRLIFFGAFGWTGRDLAQLGAANAERWRAGPSLTWSFLDLGRVRQRIQASEARAAAALAALDETTLRALEETEQALASYHAAHQQELALREAVARAHDAERLMRVRVELGRSGPLELLEIQRTVLDLDEQRIEAHAQRGSALAALYKALAGDFATAVEAASAASTGNDPSP